MSSEIKVTNIKHSSSGSNNLVLASDGSASFPSTTIGGSITNTLSAGTLGSSVLVPASIGGNEILLETYTPDNTVDNKVFEFTGSYNIYRLKINRLIPATNDSNLQLRLGPSSSDFSSSAGDYRFIDHIARYDGSTISSGQATANAENFIFVIQIGNGDQEGTSLDITIFNPTNASLATFAQGIGGSYRHDNYMYSNNFATVNKMTPRDDSHIKIYFNSGNLKAGKILLYGVKDA